MFLVFALKAAHCSQTFHFIWNLIPVSLTRLASVSSENRDYTYPSLVSLVMVKEPGSSSYFSLIFSAGWWEAGGRSEGSAQQLGVARPAGGQPLLGPLPSGLDRLQHNTGSLYLSEN